MEISLFGYDRQIFQYLIMRSHGTRPDLFGNIRSGFRRKPATAANAPKPPARKDGK